MHTGHCHCGAVRYVVHAEPSATLDDPDAIPLQIHMQTAGRLT
jgi:hypothetical protein